MTRQLIILLIMCLVFLSCGSNRGKTRTTGKVVVSVSVLSLFHPRTLTVRVLRGTQPELLLGNGRILRGSMFRINISDGKKLAVVSDDANGEGREVCLVTPAGKPWRGEFVLLVPGETERKYRGELRVVADDGNLVPVIRLPVGDLVRGVLASECSASDPSVFLRVQAVAIRSFILASRGRHELADFCDNTHCQVWLGSGKIEQPFREAAEATTGIVLMANGHVVPVPYHACCPGVTRTPAEVWGKTIPGITSVRCGYCDDARHHVWTWKVTAERLRNVLHESSIEWQNESPGKGVASVRVDGSLLSTEQFRMKLGRVSGWNKIYSNSFAVSISSDTLLFYGHGFGHGVGLCQEGAKAMSRSGYSMNTILNHYFPMLRVEYR